MVNKKNSHCPETQLLRFLSLQHFFKINIDFVIILGFRIGRVNGIFLEFLFVIINIEIFFKISHNIPRRTFSREYNLDFKISKISFRQSFVVLLFVYNFSTLTLETIVFLL